MDYHVFLLSRIRERYARTGDTREAVAHGIAGTGRLITDAVLIIVVVFAGFATGDLVGFQQMGFGWRSRGPEPSHQLPDRPPSPCRPHGPGGPGSTAT